MMKNLQSTTTLNNDVENAFVRLGYLKWKRDKNL